MHKIAPVISFPLLLLASASPLLSETSATTAHCDPRDFCSGVVGLNSPPSQYICGDHRLGPVVLQNHEILANSILGPMLTSYNPFVGSCPGAFLRKYGTSNGLRYPEKDGFELDPSGEPITKNITLVTGTIIDRFGTDRGYFVAPYGTPYEQRSLPPGN